MSPTPPQVVLLGCSALLFGCVGTVVEAEATRGDGEVVAGDAGSPDAVTGIVDDDGTTGGGSGASSGDGTTGMDNKGTGELGEQELEAFRQACVDRINMLRATLELPPLERWTQGEACADQQSEQDAQGDAAHGSFGECDEWAQNTCPGWGSVDGVVDSCLDTMWDEGPPASEPCDGECFLEHGHYLNLSSTSYSRVACGVYRMADGRAWANLNFQ